MASLVDLLKSHNLSNTRSVWVPSRNAFIDVLPMIAAHHQQLLTNLSSSKFVNGAFIRTLDTILGDVANGNNRDMKSIDRYVLALQLRQHNISDKYKATLTPQSLERVPKDSDPQVQFDIASYIAQLTANPPDLSGTAVVDDGTVRIELQIPTAKAESDFIDYVFSILDSVKEDTQPETMLGNLVIGAFVTCIQTVSIGGQKESFANLRAAEQIAIIQHLPRSVIEQITKALPQLTQVVDAVKLVKVSAYGVDDLTAEIHFDESLLVE